MTWVCRELIKEKLNFYSFVAKQFIIRMVKSGKMKWVEHVWEDINATKFWLEKPESKRPL